MAVKQHIKLSVGPLLFGWPETKVNDLYLELAGNPDVDILYLGEVVCSKRMITGIEPIVRLADELKNCGKEIILSTLAMPCNEHELQAIRDLISAAGERHLAIEANDMSAVSIASEAGVAFVAGPHLNVYTPYALQRLSTLGAMRVVPPMELPPQDIPSIFNKRGQVLNGAPPDSVSDSCAIQDLTPFIEVEYFAHGKLPLTFSARCYTARARNLSKRTCHHTCFMDPDGIEMRSLDHEGFTTINGIQIMSHRPFTVLDHVQELRQLGVGVLRISPQHEHMTDIIHRFRAVADGMQDGREALIGLAGDSPLQQQFCNGYYHGKQGRVWIE
jgi:collagenase-like PrtC family protease